MKPHPRIQKAIELSGPATALFVCSVVLAVGGCGPKWNDSSKTVEQSVFIRDLETPPDNFGSWRYGGSSKGFHYLERWEMWTKVWKEYRWSERSRGAEVDKAVAAYQLKNAKH